MSSHEEENVNADWIIYQITYESINAAIFWKLKGLSTNAFSFSNFIFNFNFGNYLLP